MSKNIEIKWLYQDICMLVSSFIYYEVNINSLYSFNWYICIKLF